MHTYICKQFYKLANVKGKRNSMSLLLKPCYR